MVSTVLLKKLISFLGTFALFPDMLRELRLVTKEFHKVNNAPYLLYIHNLSSKGEKCHRQLILIDTLLSSYSDFNYLSSPWENL